MLRIILCKPWTFSLWNHQQSFDKRNERKEAVRHILPDRFACWFWLKSFSWDSARKVCPCSSKETYKFLLANLMTLPGELFFPVIKLSILEIFSFHSAFYITIRSRSSRSLKRTRIFKILLCYARSLCIASTNCFMGAFISGFRQRSTKSWCKFSSSTWFHRVSRRSFGYNTAQHCEL